MFTIDTADNTISVTKGDILFFSVGARDKISGENYIFQPGDIVRISVYGKKNCEDVLLQKDFVVETPSEEVEIYLEEKETKIGGVINKAKVCWYEVVLNPDTKPQTIIGFSNEGEATFTLYPEGGDITEGEPEEPEKDIGNLDSELDPLSERAVKNSAVARAVLALNSAVNVIRARITNFTSLKEGSTSGDAELQDIRVAADGTVYENAGEAVRRQVKDLSGRVQIIENEEKYALTEEDKQEIAEIAVNIIDTSLLEILGTGDAK